MADQPMKMYYDDDGDMVVISSQLDLDEALKA